MDINQIRFANYKYLFEQFKEMTRRDDPGAPEKGMMKLFGERVGVREAYMSHINTGYKNIGPKTARQFEEALKLPSGWMDQQHDKKRQQAEPVRQSASTDSDEQVTNPADAEELQFLQTAIEFYRNDPVRAQAALLQALSAKFRS
jgi:hypothetical protein